jgi:uncharacterized protein (TIGR02597 family)
MLMKRSIILSLASACLAVLPQLVSAQTVATEAVGFTTNTALGNSDTHISPPFVRPPAFVGGIQSTSGNTITVSGSPFTPNQFVYNGSSQRNHYYALVGSGPSANPKEGRTYPITGNGSNTLTVQLSQDDLVGIPANTQVTVIPNWTLATVFPPSDQNVSFTPTTSAPTYKTQILPLPGPTFQIPPTTSATMPGASLAMRTPTAVTIRCSQIATSSSAISTARRPCRWSPSAPS